jgi:hypothetical protein
LATHPEPLFSGTGKKDLAIFFAFYRISKKNRTFAKYFLIEKQIYVKKFSHC